MTITCDECEDSGDCERESIPDGWLELTLTDSEDNEATAIVCSYECAGSWIESLQNGEDDDDEEEEEDDDDDEDEDDDE